MNTSAASGTTPPSVVIDPLLPLVGPAIAGDPAATRALLKSVTPAIAVVARHVVRRSNADPEDCVQDCLVMFLRALPRFEVKSSVTHYARRIAARHCLGVLRQQRLRSNLFDRAQREDVAEPPPLPHEALEAVQRRRLLRELLDTLPVAQSEALFLRVAAGLSLEEVALETAAPINTVRSRIQLATHALRARVDRDPSLRRALGLETEG